MKIYNEFTYEHKTISDLLDETDNIIDIILIKLVIDIQNQWYDMTYMKWVILLQKRFAEFLVFLKLREPLDSLDFIDLDFD
jgi:hypothetical protein